MYNNIAFRYCWVHAGLDPNDFNKNVYLCALGDDNIFSVNSKYRGVFNELTLTHLMKAIGLTYTNENKTESVVANRRIYEVNFLKRGFRYEKTIDRWVAPISMVTIINELDWTKKTDADPITKEKTVIALRELSLHGEAKYNQHASEILEVAKKNLDHRPPDCGWPTSWADTMMRVVDTDHYLC
nr:MAG: RNA-dependent RNA polymerase [Chemarfal virus 190]